MTPQLDARLRPLAAHPHSALTHCAIYVVLPLLRLPTCGCDRAPRSFPRRPLVGVHDDVKHSIMAAGSTY